MSKVLKSADSYQKKRNKFNQLWEKNLKRKTVFQFTLIKVNKRKSLKLGEPKILTGCKQPKKTCFLRKVKQGKLQ